MAFSRNGPGPGHSAQPSATNVLLQLSLNGPLGKVKWNEKYDVPIKMFYSGICKFFDVPLM